MKGSIYNKKFAPSRLKTFLCAGVFITCHYLCDAVGKPVSPLPLAKKIIFTFPLYPDGSQTSVNSQPEQPLADFTALIENNVRNRKSRRTMLHLLRMLKIKKLFGNEESKTQLYTELAAISAKMKLYPLTMQFLYQEMVEKQSERNDAAGELPGINMSSAFTELDSTLMPAEPYGNGKAVDVSVDDLLGSFNDGKDADDYAIIIHVKQPVNGNRKAFTGIDNVGHMFITLIKYNVDKTYVSRSFGFYPVKKKLLSATPLQPSTSSAFKDDEMHEWDEAIGKFISYKRFIKIINLLARYEYKPYNLNENNCTDFGLAAALLSGIYIKETSGKWLLGKGNNPANAGQSILENKLLDENTYKVSDLFVFKK
jgi:hypothetical protein